MECVCPICGKVFVKPVKSIYKRVSYDKLIKKSSTIYLCGYSCTRKFDDYFSDHKKYNCY